MRGCLCVLLLVCLTGCEDSAKVKELLSQLDKAHEYNVALKAKVAELEKKVQLETTPQEEIEKKAAADLQAAKDAFTAEKSIMVTEIDGLKHMIVLPELQALQRLISESRADCAKRDVQIAALQGQMIELKTSYDKMVLSHAWTKGNCCCQK